MAITPTAVTNISTPASNDVVVLIDQSLPVSDHSSEESTVWVTIGRCVLYVTDELLIENGSELMDKHMQFAQNLIKSRYPLIGGLHLTILQGKPYSRGCRAANTIQIVYSQRESTGLLYQLSGVKVTRWQCTIGCLHGWMQTPEPQS